MTSTSLRKPNILEIVAFGHRYGPLYPAPAMSYDVRNIPNPPRELRHKLRASNDPTALRRWLLTNEIFLASVTDARREILQSMSSVDRAYSADGYHLIVGVNCHLGRHRSVTFANELEKRLEEELGPQMVWDIRVRHRDLQRRSSKRSEILPPSEVRG